jgi:lysophospholipase L1-like esterase
MPAYRIATIFLRMVLFLAAAALLAWRCRQGAAFIEVGVLFVLYVAASALWVRGQYQASVDAARKDDENRRPWTFPLKVSIPVAGGGLYVAYLGVKHDHGTLLLVGGIVAYFAAGYILMNLRMYREKNNGAAAPPTPSYLISGPIALLAGGATILAWKHGHEILTFFAALIAYVVVALAVARLRAFLAKVEADSARAFAAAKESGGPAPHLSWWPGVWVGSRPFRTGWVLRVIVGSLLAIVSLLLLFIGLWNLEDESGALIAVAIGLLSAPLGMSILAEPATRVLLAPVPAKQVIAIGALVAGLLLFWAMVWWATASVGTPAVALGALVALGLLVFAIVSSTQADIAVVIAAICLMGVTSMTEDKSDALTPQPGQTRVLVALGDSYMSGEGARIFYTEDNNEDHHNHCNRAPTAWAALAGQTARSFDSVEFLACSGSRTFNVRHEHLEGDKDTRLAQYNEPGTQLDQYDEFKARMEADGQEFTPRLAVISLGGNDAGFSTIGAMCLAPGDCYDKRDLWERSLGQVEKALKETYVEVSAEFPRTPVLVVPYPSPIYTDANNDPVTCPQVTLSADDMKFIGEFLPMLNERVKNSADSQQFYYLDTMPDALKNAHLQLCDPDNDNRPGINFVGLRSVGGIAEQRFNPANWYHNSLHPNERGHAAMRQVFEDWLAEMEDPDDGEEFLARTTKAATEAAAAEGESVSGGGPAQPVPESEPAADETVVTKTQCDLFDEQNPDNCRTSGMKWAKGQVAHKLVRDGWGLLIVLAALGAWLASVGLFATWKPWWGTPPVDD